MKIPKKSYLQIRITEELKRKAEIIIAEKYKKSLSEYVREKLEEVIRTND